MTQPPDARLRHALRPPGPELRRLLQRLELLPGPVERGATRRVSTSSAATPASIPCAAANRRAMDPATGQFLGTASQASIIVGTLVPNVGNTDERPDARRPGHRQDRVHLSRAGLRAALRRRLGRQGRSALRRPRRDRALLRSAAGQQHLRRRRAIRRCRRTSPCATATCRTSRAPGCTTVAPPSITVFAVRQHAAVVVPVEHRHCRSSLPFASALDVSYTGQHSYNTQNTVNLNSIDLGHGVPARSTRIRR